jgi:D-psicose/D-tagatose/L-ribulose 3-epimerase
MKIGVNTWVWTSPLTVDELAPLAAHIAGMGFDLVEVPIESTTDLDYSRAGAIARDHGLAVTVCAAMSPDRDLIHPDESVRATGMAYVRHCIEAAYTMGSARVAGPL